MAFSFHFVHPTSGRSYFRHFGGRKEGVTTQEGGSAASHGREKLLYSRMTCRGFLSSRRRTNLMWRTWLLSVHSRNSKFPTSFGRTQMHLRILSAVSPSCSAQAAAACLL